MRLVHAWDMGLFHRWMHTQPDKAGVTFSRFVQRFSAEADVTLLALDFDGPTRRHEIYPAYKSTRPKRTPEEEAALRAQRDAALASLQQWGARVRWAEGWEADDVVATIASTAREEGYGVMVVSGDKDLAQLLPLGIRLHDTKNEITAETILAKFGVKPEQVVDYLSLAGDGTDDVPGVPGLGPKTAPKLLAQYGTLDAITEAGRWLDGPAGRVYAHREAALLSRRLVQLNLAVPLHKGTPDSSA